MDFSSRQLIPALILSLLAGILLSCNNATDVVPEAPKMYFPPLHGPTWATEDPASLAWCSDKLSPLNNFLDQKNTKAFIMLHNGKIAVEWYFGNFKQDSLWYWASAGKTLISFLIGKAQEEGYLSIEDNTSGYLGTGWTSATPEKEDLITIRHQLSMTTGLIGVAGDIDCTDKNCLRYKADAGTRWAYHNAPYTLLGNVIESATGMSRNQYTRTRLGDKIGMDGLWIKLNFNYVYFSTARSMARFGLLVLNNGLWEDTFVLEDTEYMSTMHKSSQDINPSYGYLWWLNGKGKHMLPLTQIVFNTDLIPNAPDDVFAALGKNDQKLYIWPSESIVVVRMGNSAEHTMLASSSFDNQLWQYITDLACE